MVTDERQTGAGLLLDTVDGPIRHAIVDWALRRGVFDLCRDFTAASALTEGMGLKQDRLLLVLRALGAAGVLEHRGNSFRTAPDILPFVASDSPRNMVETLRGMAAIRLAGLDGLDALLAGDTAPACPPLFDEAHWDAHHLSLSAFHRGIAADVMEPCLTGLPEWPNARSLLEIGPGSAVLTQRLLSLRPDLSITLFDLPSLARRIAQDLAHQPVRVVAGNYNETLPEGHFDIIWCSMTLYFHDRGLPELIARIAGHLAPGGVLVSLHAMLSEDRTFPPEHAIGRLMPALRHGDSTFEDGEMAGAMALAGLSHPQTTLLSTPFGRVRLDTARRKA